MVATTMRKPMTATAGRGAARQMGRPAPRPPAHHVEPVHPKPHSRALTYAAAGMGAAALIAGLVVIYLFGNAGLRTIATPPVGGNGQVPAAVAPGAAPTLVYRDLHDGRVMVMEIDANGTRVVGTMAKQDVPMATNMYREPKQRSIDSSTRLQALGDPFR